jgi:hypothetical protein
MERDMTIFLSSNLQIHFPALVAGHVKPASPGPGAAVGAPKNTLRGLVLNVSAARSTERAAERTSSASELTRGSVS